MEPDAEVERGSPRPHAGATHPGRATDVLEGGCGFSNRANATRDTIPIHLVVGKDVPTAVAEFYARMCPAGVYELAQGALRVNAPNCVDCKATDVLGPRWTPREGGSRPSTNDVGVPASGMPDQHSSRRPPRAPPP